MSDTELRRSRLSEQESGTIVLCISSCICDSVSRPAKGLLCILEGAAGVGPGAGLENRSVFGQGVRLFRPPLGAVAQPRQRHQS
jgi:hypothetical protein